MKARTGVGQQSGARRGPLRHRRTQRGFTLVELVMTLMLLVIGVPALITLGNQCLQNLHQGAFVTTASALSQEKLEHILADVACDSRGPAYIIAGNYPAENPVTGFPGYTRSVTIAADSTFNGIVFRNVQVTTTAPDGTASSLSTWVLP